MQIVKREDRSSERTSGGIEEIKVRSSHYGVPPHCVEVDTASVGYDCRMWVGMIENFPRSIAA